MNSPHDIPVRSARNHLIDLLNVGDTYPLTDLDVIADQLKVAFGGTAKIPIESAQAGVAYQLCDPKGVSLGDAFRLDGNDARLEIESPKVEENVTYRILAIKQLPAGQPPQEPRFLDERAPVTVGIDTLLPIEILDAPLLDPSISNPQPSAPRIVAYGTSVGVQVAKSQEGVQYSLVIDGRELTEVVLTGDLGSIILPTGSMFEDAEIRVRATKTFLGGETDRKPETVLLDGQLFLKVRANRALAVAVVPAPVIGYRADAAIRISGSQKSASYRLWLRNIPDRDFLHGRKQLEGVDVALPFVTVPVAGKPDVQIRRPPVPILWELPDGYGPGGSAVAGNGGDLEIAIKGWPDDVLVLVQALKLHQAGAAGSDLPSIESAVALDQAAGLLVQPDPARKLTLRISNESEKLASVEVSGGQPGVFYWFRPAPDGPEWPLPAYFHKRDDGDVAQNKGIGQLGVEIDFVLGKLAKVQTTGGIDRSRLLPLDPVLAVALISTVSLASRAVKAQTGVEVAMAAGAELGPVPQLRADPGVVDFGAPTNIVIAASVATNRYQLKLAGAAVGAPVAGTGADLSVVTDPIFTDTVFDLEAIPVADAAMRVTRTAQVAVAIRPDAKLAVAAAADEVDKGGATTITVRAGASGVVYQLMVEKTPIGSPAPGSGGDLSFDTGPIVTDTTFTVAAARAGKPEIAIVLAASATVKVKLPAEAPPANVEPAVETKPAIVATEPATASTEPVAVPIDSAAETAVATEPVAQPVAETVQTANSAVAAKTAKPAKAAKIVKPAAAAAPPVDPAAPSSTAAPTATPDASEPPASTG